MKSFSTQNVWGGVETPNSQAVVHVNAWMIHQNIATFSATIRAFLGPTSVQIDVPAMAHAINRLSNGLARETLAATSFSVFSMKRNIHIQNV